MERLSARLKVQTAAQRELTIQLCVFQFNYRKYMIFSTEFNAILYISISFSQVQLYPTQYFSVQFDSVKFLKIYLFSIDFSTILFNLNPVQYNLVQVGCFSVQFITVLFHSYNVNPVQFSSV